MIRVSISKCLCRVLCSSPKSGSVSRALFPTCSKIEFKSACYCAEACYCLRLDLDVKSMMSIGACFNVCWGL